MTDSKQVQGNDEQSGQDGSLRVDQRTEQDGSLKVHGDKLERLIPRDKEEEHSPGGDAADR
jgi:hypothetical protein